MTPFRSDRHSGRRLRLHRSRVHPSEDPDILHGVVELPESHGLTATIQLEANGSGTTGFFITTADGRHIEDGQVFDCEQVDELMDALNAAIDAEMPA
jgi:formylmethanofuran dehydrogenase subunit A